MLLDTLKEEDSISLAGDDLMKTLNEIAQKSATERPLMDSQAIFHSPIGKIEKEKLNTKERRSSQQIQFVEKEALQCRANSLKRAMNSIAEYSRQLQEKRYSIHCENMCVFTSSSSDTSPWSSPVPPINIISPSVSTTQLTCLSPLPDFRIDSVDEYFFNSLHNLPVPKQFADSRRSSGVAETSSDEKGATLTVGSGSSATPSALSLLTAIKIVDENADIFQLCSKPDSKKDFLPDTESDSSNFNRIGYMAYSETEQRDDGFGFMPFEVYERNLLRNQTAAATNSNQSSNQSITTVTEPTTTIKSTELATSSSSCITNLLQIPQTNISIERIHMPLTLSTASGTNGSDNIYESESITLIDIDQPVSTYF